MKKRFSIISLYFFDALIIIASFLLVGNFKDFLGGFTFYDYQYQFTTFTLVFFIVSFFNQKYKLYLRKNISSVIAKILITNTYVLLILLFILYSFHIFSYSRLLLFGTLILTTIFELIIFSGLYFSYRFHLENTSFSSTKLVSETYESPVVRLEKSLSENKSIEQSESEIKFTPRDNFFKEFLLQLLDKQSVELKSFFDQSLNLNCFSKSDSLILNSESIFNVEIYSKEELEFFLNLHQINDIRRLNNYFIEVNRVLKQGGVFCLVVETISLRYDRIIKTFGKFFGKVLYFADFVFRRVFPKLPFFQGIYFGLTNGINRALSTTETLGRLYFCGFEVLKVKQINGLLYVIAQKVKEPSKDTSPTYGPLIKLNRYGKDGNLIKVYKFRTMHPYSEYLHSFVTQLYGFGEKGKVDDDIRVTSWGKFLRKFWLDEIPQFYNLFKGELALIGVRPLSKRFLDEYPEDLKQERLKYKPGCLPPYVAFKMQSVDQYLESERMYLAMKKKHPFWTDVKIFFLAIYNILTGKIRSE